MIASVNFQMAGRPRTAVITDRLVWYCSDKVAEGFLNTCFDPKAGGPSTGWPGEHAASMAAGVLQNAKVSFNRPQNEPEEGVIY